MWTVNSTWLHYPNDAWPSRSCIMSEKMYQHSCETLLLDSLIFHTESLKRIHCYTLIDNFITIYTSSSEPSIWSSTPNSNHLQNTSDKTSKSERRCLSISIRWENTSEPACISSYTGIHNEDTVNFEHSLRQTVYNYIHMHAWTHDMQQPIISFMYCMSIKTCMDELTCHKGIARWAVSKKTFHVLLDFIEFSI